MAVNKQEISENNVSTGAILLKFLGSMNLAITLLVAVSIASVIGTVLQQNQPYTDYVLKFGPFWFEVFKTLDLFDVYASGWFLVILAFLVVSTSVCIYRNAPSMLREMNNFRQQVQRKSLRNHRHSQQWQVAMDTQEAAELSRTLLKHYGFRTRDKAESDHTLISAMKGAGSRLGYVLTHLAIVVICIGGLLDGTALIKLYELSGGAVPETRNMPANQVPAKSRLGLENLSFRGSVTIPEGRQADVAFINYKDGYLVQALPFTIEVKDFRIEHYPNGQPKSFESDLVVYDDQLEAPLEQTISVNHPLIYRGYSIYQASFGDGGTKLELKSWPFASADREPQMVSAIVSNDLELKIDGEPWTLEVSDFRLFNINPVEGEEREFKNVGPSIQYKLRSQTGEAKEYMNYMLPMERDGAKYYLSGTRSTPSEEFRYLHIPINGNGRIDRFMNFLARLQDKELLREMAKSSLGDMVDNPEFPIQDSERFVSAMLSLVELFRNQGIQGVISMVQNTVPEDKRQDVVDIYVRILQQMLAETYVGVLESEGVDVSQGLDESLARYFDDATTAIGALGNYAAPVYFQLQVYDHKQASGLQVAKAPGKYLVYPGCAMLILGVFFMFYMPQRRCWVWLEPGSQGSTVLLSGTAIRNRLDFGKEYAKIEEHFSRVFGQTTTDKVNL